ncbi:TetR/AcrR family transcriptional regulator [Nocardia huaxiensis]|uniref:TetR/AcrR family transcriptional regulator n=1 Tax=Nocardia huaxiensis TaxID=2755382 RepID=A0A7D6ZEB4_9NOCA|nr:TetR/AcrR family transcriptional regulator [Nocardia huaxiensis]QLY28127.1 TetR/AcrR family transcriptional regulator [Nocardia huaxiensis]
MVGKATGGATRRAERRAETIAEIKSLAREQLAENGTGGLTLRGIARSMRMSPAAIFRYFDTQSALVTALCVDAYNSLADAIADASQTPGLLPPDQWRAICHATRRWALDHPADYALTNGTPIPGYQAQPEDTGPAAGRIMASVASAYLAAIAGGDADPAATAVPALAAGPLLTAMLDGTELPDSPVPGIILNAWSSILGFISAEIFGSLRNLVSDTDVLFDAHVTTVMNGMGFRDATAG